MIRTGARVAVLAGTVAAVATLAPAAAGAQEPALARRWELRGMGLDFAPDGVWRAKARRVAAARTALMGRGELSLLNAPVRAGAPLPSALAVTGTLRVPAILLRFADTPTGTLRDSSEYTRTLFGATPPAGRPYTVRTLYEEMSNGLFSMQGEAIGWVALASAEAAYTGPAGTCTTNPYGTGNSNGIFCGAYTLLQAGLREAIVHADSTVDFGRYDNDGPDGRPNSGDDDGYVDLVIFVQPMKDGACVSSTNNHVWSHRYALSGSTTADAWAGHPGQFIKVRDYTIQPGVGGAAACDETQIMAIGTAAHETGHGLGLPDFYDTDPSDGDDSEGIGHWGLMGSGNYATALSPASLEALSRSILGWVTVRQLTTSGTYALGPSAVGDTVFLIRPTGSNPRGEYFLLENRQSALADTALIRLKGPGLLVWHVDEVQYNNGYYSNTINSGPIHGLWLLQADGLNQLRSSTSGVRNRGDAGDPFPGTANNTALNGVTSPNNRLNAGFLAGFSLDSISETASPPSPVRFRVAFGGTLVVAAADTAAKVRVRGQPTALFRQFLIGGDTATIDIDSLQTSPAGTAQFVFLRWSDGGARSHLVTVPMRDTTITAAVTRRYDLRWTVDGPGTVSATPGVPATGSWVTDGDTVALTARPNPGAIFMGWTGGVTTAEPNLTIRAVQPYALTATFSAAPVDSVVHHLIAGTGLTVSQLLMLDYVGNRNGRFDLGDFVAWLDQSGTAISTERLASIFARVRR